jgi:hypothetical protein
MGNITLAELDAITARSVANQKAEWGQPLTDYERSLVGVSIKNIAPNYAALKEQTEAQKNALTIGTVTFDEKGRVQEEVTTTPGVGTTTTRYTYTIHPTTPVSIRPSMYQTPMQYPSMIPVSSAIQRRSNAQLVELAAQESYFTSQPQAMRPGPTSIQERNVAFLLDKDFSTRKTSLEYLPAPSKAEFAGITGATLGGMPSSETLLFKAEKARSKSSAFSATGFAYGLASVPVMVYESPGESVATFGMFVINPLLGASFVAATSGKELVEQTIRSPSYTAGQLFVGSLIGNAPKIKGVYKSYHNNLILNAPMRAGYEPYFNPRKTFEVAEFSFTESGEPVMTLNYPLSTTETVLVRGGTETQYKLKPGGASLSALSDITRFREQSLMSTEQPYNPAQAKLEPLIGRGDVSSLTLTSPLGESISFKQSAPLITVERKQLSITESLTRFEDIHSPIMGTGDIAVFSPTESYNFVKTESMPIFARLAPKPYEPIITSKPIATIDYFTPGELAWHEKQQGGRIGGVFSTKQGGILLSDSIGLGAEYSRGVLRHEATHALFGDVELPAVMNLFSSRKQLSHLAELRGGEIYAQKIYDFYPPKAYLQETRANIPQFFPEEMVAPTSAFTSKIAEKWQDVTIEPTKVSKVTGKELPDAVDFGFNRMFVVEPFGAAIIGTAQAVKILEPEFRRVTSDLIRGGRTIFERTESTFKVIEDAGLTMRKSRFNVIFGTQRGVAERDDARFTPITRLDVMSGTGVDFKYNPIFATDANIDVRTIQDTKRKQRQKQDFRLITTPSLITTTAIIPEPEIPAPRFDIGEPPPPIKEIIPEEIIPVWGGDRTTPFKRKQKNIFAINGLAPSFAYVPSIEANLYNIRGSRKPRIQSIELRPILR